MTEAQREDEHYAFPKISRIAHKSFSSIDNPLCFIAYTRENIPYIFYTMLYIDPLELFAENLLSEIYILVTWCTGTI